MLSLSSDIKVSIIDYVVKIVGGALTFVLLAVALRRKFENLRLERSYLQVTRLSRHTLIYGIPQLKKRRP